MDEAGAERRCGGAAGLKWRRRCAGPLACAAFRWSPAPPRSVLTCPVRSGLGSLALWLLPMGDDAHSGSPFFTQMKHPDGFHSYFVHGIMSVCTPPPRRRPCRGDRDGGRPFCFFRSHRRRGAAVGRSGDTTDIAGPPLSCALGVLGCARATSHHWSPVLSLSLCYPPLPQFSYPSRTEDCPPNFPDWGTRVSHYTDWITERVIYE